jgi:hypothetical protein
MNRSTTVVLLCACLIFGSSAAVWAIKPITFGITAAKTKVGYSLDDQQPWSTGLHSLAVLGTDVYATWVNMGKELCVAVNRNNSGFFESRDIVMTGPTSGYGATIAAINNSSNNHEIHLAWFDNSSGTGKIYYSRSVNPPSWWEGPYEVQGTVPAGWGNSIAADSAGNVYIAFQSPGGGVYVVSSDDGGTTWGTPLQINTSPAGNAAPSIATDANGTVHVGWFDNVSNKVYYAKKLNGVQSWSDEVAINGTTPGFFVSLATSQDGSSIYATWSRTGYGTICAYSNDGGTTWNADDPSSEPSVVDGTSTNSDTSIAVSPATGEVNIAYKIGGQVYLARSLSNGVYWEQNVTIDDEFSGKWGPYPNVAVGADNKAHIMWKDNVMIAYTKEP